MTFGLPLISFLETVAKLEPPISRLVILKDPEGKEIGRGSGLAISKVQELEAGSTISFRSGHLLHSVGFLQSV